jgi:streptomycin 6-kinase
VRRLGVVAEAANLDPSRLLLWVLAYAGLSAAWSIDDGYDPRTALSVAEIAAAELRP